MTSRENDLYEVFKHWMAYKNHQSAQLGIEQLVLLYTPI